MIPNQPRIFISYARSDDEPFVKQLYEDLTARGYSVWWDRVAMPSRALTFLQEIRDAIDKAGRVLLVVGPGAVNSEYVAAEWRYALEACLGVLPVLRLVDPKHETGPYKLLPPELANLDCVDVRSNRPYEVALAEILDKLSEPVPPLGSLLGEVPALPAHFQPRPAYIASLHDHLLADVERPVVISAAQRTATLHGMGGIGKTVLASAFARACPTRRAFTDGIVWATLGTNPDLRSVIQSIGLAFGDGPEHYVDEGTARAHLPKVLEDKVALLVLDNVWDVAHVQPFVNALGPRCRLLATTRDGGLAAVLGADEQRVDLLDDAAARQLLADWAQQPMTDLPAEADAVAKECGNLPLALAMSGAMIGGQPANWPRVLHRLRTADLAKIRQEFPNYPYPNLLAAIQVSVDTLADPELVQLYPGLQQRYIDLAVFPKQTPIPVSAIQALWAPADVDSFDTQDMIDILVRRSLLTRDDQGRLLLHDLLHDYVHKQAQSDLLTLHNQLLDGYADQCANGWPSGPDDGYFFQYLADHLVGANRVDELRALLFDFAWLSTKLAATNASALVADYERLAGDMVMPRLGRALRQAAYILAQDPQQLASQLLGRLLDDPDPTIQALLQQATASQQRPWLRPLTPSLRDAEALVLTLTGHERSVNSVIVTSDDHFVLTASDDGTIKVWNLKIGKCIRTFQEGGQVYSLAVTPDSRFAISASDDRTVKIWAMENGQLLHTFEREKETPYMVAVTPDSRFVIATYWPNILKVWELEGKHLIRTIESPQTFWPSVAVTPDGRFAFYISDDTTTQLPPSNNSNPAWHRSYTSADGFRSRFTLKMWRPEQGLHVDFLGQPTDLNNVIVTPDNRFVICASNDMVSVWDLKSGQQVKEFKEKSKINSIAIARDGHWILSALDNWTITVRNLDIENSLYELEGHTGVVKSISITSSGRFAISASADQTAKIWELGSNGHRFKVAKHAGPVNSVAVTTNGRFAISASDDCVLKVWDLETGQFIYNLEGHTGPVNSVAVTSDGCYGLSASRDHTIKVWDLQSRQIERNIVGEFVAPKHLLVTPDGRFIVFSDQGHVKIGELESGQLVKGFEYQKDYSKDCVIKSKTVCKEWDTASLMITTDGRFAISTHDQGCVRVWEIESEQLTSTFYVSGSPIAACAAVIHDVGYVVCALDDNRLTIHNLRGGEFPNRRVVGLHSKVTGVAVTPNGRFAVSVSENRSIQVWDLVATQEGNGFECVATLLVDSALRTCVVAPDGTTIVVGDTSGRVHFLRLENV